MRAEGTVDRGSKVGTRSHTKSKSLAYAAYAVREIYQSSTHPLSLSLTAFYCMKSVML
jgi:hypothetical protein